MVNDAKKEEILKGLEEIKAQTNCPQDFMCLKFGLEIYEQLEIGDTCAQDSHEGCTFAKEEGSKIICTCPVMKYLGEKFKEE